MLGVGQGVYYTGTFLYHGNFLHFSNRETTPGKLASLLNSQPNYCQYVDYKALFHLEYIIYCLFASRFLMFKMQSNAYLAFFNLLLKELTLQIHVKVF